MSHVPTGSQTVGPFFSIGLSALCRENIECEHGAGDGVTIRGRVLDGDAQPVPDAMLEIWQASDAAQNESGIEEGVPHVGNNPLGFGRIATNEKGEFRFTTRKPLARRDADATVHAPHLVVVILMRGLLRQLVTRIYFAGEAANADDAVLKIVPAERRGTLLATRTLGPAGELEWNIHLQGERETVFFEA
jgi:protocatechuate 3,4-dioxygenase, alpha subunit